LIGVKSTALKFGDATKQWLSFFAVGTTSCLGLSAYLAHSSPLVYLGLLSGAVHLAWQIKTVDLDDRQDCWDKFESNKWYGMIIFSSFVVANMLS